MENSSPQKNAAQVSYPHKWWILTAIGVSLFMSSIDGTIVNVALPTLTRELSTDFATIQWVVLSYLLGLAVLMLSMGRLGDMLGKKKVYSVGLIIFVFGSMLCGLAPNIHWLIGFRFLQSIGASMMMALGVAIVTETWPARERGKAIGISGGIISLGIAAGPALGGFILQYLNWRWIFFVNVPIGIAAFTLVWIFIPALAPKQMRERFDFAGAFLVGLGLLAISLSMTFAQHFGLTSPQALGLFGVSVLALVAFVWVERKVRFPMIDLSLLANPDMSSGLFTGFLTFVSIAAVVLILPFYLELVMGLDQQEVGMLMAVVPIVLGILGPLSGMMSDRVGTRPVSIVGLALLVVGYFTLTRLTVHSQPLNFVLALLPVGLGMGIFQTPNNTSIMNAAPRTRLGIASGMLSMSRTLGQSTGIALLSAYFAIRLNAYAGGVVDINAARPADIVNAMQDQFYITMLLIVIGLAVILGQGWIEWRSPRR